MRNSSVIIIFSITCFICHLAVGVQEPSLLPRSLHKMKKERHKKFSSPDIRCPEPFGLFPHPVECSKFLNCAHGQAHVQSCGPGTLFSSRLSICDHARKVDCSSRTADEDSVTTDATASPFSTSPSHPRGKEGTRLFPGFFNSLGKTVRKLKRKLGEAITGTKRGMKSNVETSLGAVASTYHKVGKKVGAKASTYFKTSSPQMFCLKHTGLFPYPKDCSKFVNCWKGRATLMDCAPGTMFDASTQQCSWPGRVVCASLPGSHELPPKFALDIPPSGQLVRLRRGGKPYVGYLQIWLDGDWRPVVATSETWETKERICLGLGFTRGAHSESRGLVYGWPSQLSARVKSLVCSGTHFNPTECPIRVISKDELAKSIVGIRCRQNSVSECPPSWHRWGAKCYSVNTADKESQADAKQRCEEGGGRLLSIMSQEENDFVSYLLASVGLLPEPFHSGGITFSLQKERYWAWQGTEAPFTKELQYTKWWPGWGGRKDDPSQDTLEDDLESSCIRLQESFEAEGLKGELSAKYYFWKLGDCEEKLNFVCEREPLEIGCIQGRGEDYEGPANTTGSGAPCLLWSQKRGAFRGLSQKKHLRSNACSNPDGDDLPWCFVEGGTTEFCDIPRCPYLDPVKVEIETPKCGAGLFTCKTGECVHLEWICDGQQDCPGGEEEENCPDYGDMFKKNSGMMLNGSQVEKWLFSPKPTCAIRCAQAKNFVCHSFNYEESTSTCLLSKSNAGLSGGLVMNDRWEYHERIDLAPDCSKDFICSDYKCVLDSKVCDGKRDCARGEDENDCMDISNFAVRLVNGSGHHEGRVEIRVAGRWGQVCDDMWGIEDGHVVCRQLGFERGAKKSFTNSRFGNGAGLFLMDDLNCRGTESSLAECDFGGWGREDCDASEAAGVSCYLESDVCSSSQWRCANGRCIEFAHYCDQIDDCGDASDERVEVCTSPISIRLGPDPSQGKSLDPAQNQVSPPEGRVEVRYKGIWGTVCDDDISINEGHVICRMLGWEGAVLVLKNNSFGAGTGPIWIDGLQCLGNEKMVTECQHERWGSTNCDHTEDLGVSCTNDLSKEQKEKLLQTEPPPIQPPVDVLPSQCGIRYVDDTPKEVLASPRIVEGFLSERGAQPWMAGLRRRTSIGSTHECGAFILSEDLIMTAAHCLWRYPISEYLVRTGDYNNEVKDSFEEEWLAESIIVHPKFDKGVLFNNDLGLLKIKRKEGRGIIFGDRVQPICLTGKDFNYQSGLKCTVAGWGTRSSDSGYSRILQSTLLPILPDSDCRADHVYGPTRISSGMFCAGYMEGGIDTCQGDSGGPLVCVLEGRYTAVGITSWGHGCARANKPGVYTKLSYYLDWIYNVTTHVIQV